MLKLLIAMGLTVLPIAAMADCASDADALTKQYHLPSSLPHVTGNAADTSMKLAESGGVIAAPQTGTVGSTVRQPLVSDPEPMQTAPALPPQAVNKLATNGSAEMAGADTDAASLLAVAREAGLHGDQNTCERNVEEARRLLMKTAPSAD